MAKEDWRRNLGGRRIVNSVVEKKTENSWQKKIGETEDLEKSVRYIGNIILTMSKKINTVWPKKIGKQKR